MKKDSAIRQLNNKFSGLRIGASPSANDRIIVLEKLIAQVDERFEALREMLSDTPELLDEVDSIAKPLNDLLDSAPLNRVGFYGPRGVGKTTLLNRLLNCPKFLPTGQYESITASITEVIGWKKAGYRVVAHLLNEKAWADVVSSTREELKTTRDARTRDSEEDEPGPLASAMLDYLKALWGDSHSLTSGSLDEGFGWEQVANELSLIPPESHEDVRKGFTLFETSDKKEVMERLLSYTHRSQPFWPLTSKLTVYGPFPLLTTFGFTVVDIPGSGDGDTTLGRRFAEGRALCDHLFYLPESSRTLFTKKTKTKILNFEYTTSKFGVIVQRARDIMKGKTDLAELPGWFRDKLNKTAVGRDISDSLPVFFIEHKPGKDDKPDNFDAFVQHISTQDRTDSLISKYTTHTNMIFQTLRSMELDQVKLKEAQRIFEEIGKYIETLPTKIVPQDCKIEYNSKQKVELIYSSIHFATLQKWLRANDLELVARIVEPFFANSSNSWLDNLESFVQSQRKLLQDAVLERMSRLPSGFDMSSDVVKDWAASPLDDFISSTHLRVCEDIRSRYQSEFHDMRRTGRGCRNEMLSLVRAWWLTNKSRLVEEIGAMATKWALAVLGESISKLRGMLTFNNISKIAAVPKSDTSRLLSLLAHLNSDPAKNQPVTRVGRLAPVSLPPALQQCISSHPVFLSAPNNIRPGLDRKNSHGYVYVASSAAFGPGVHRIGYLPSDPRESFKGTPIQVEPVWETTQPRTFMHVVLSALSSVRFNR